MNWWPFTRKPLTVEHCGYSLSWPWPAERKPLVIEHVRYTKRSAIDPLDKALAMARQMNDPDLISRVEAVRAGK